MFHVLPSNISVNIHTSTTEHAKYSFLEKPYISIKFCQPIARPNQLYHDVQQLHFVFTSNLNLQPCLN